MWTVAEPTAAALERELAWFEQQLQQRLAGYFGTAEGPAPALLAAPPEVAGDDPWSTLVGQHALDAGDRMLLMLALAPTLRPQLLDLLFVRNANLDRGFTEFGGWKGKVHGGFLPSGETAAFVLGGEALWPRFEALRRLRPDQPLRRAGLLLLEAPEPGEPLLSGPLLPSPELLARLTTGGPHRPDHGPGFPARRLESTLGWDDLVLAPEVMDEVQAILAWVRDGAALLRDWQLERAVKPGWRSLFHGPPGTGKTLTATLIGQAAAVDVYRVDLSLIVSKYIGETEKNLAAVFDQAEHQGWILFFDEADALFGKRTATSSSNDRFANQEVSYLLQRVEDFAGTVILASNLKANIDEAFARRFQSIVYFPLPDAAQRLQLWRGLLPDPGRWGPDVDLPALAEMHELSGGAIANVVRHAAVCAHRAGRRQLGGADLRRGVARELRKEGRTMQEAA